MADKWLSFLHLCNQLGFLGSQILTFYYIEIRCLDKGLPLGKILLTKWDIWNNNHQVSFLSLVIKMIKRQSHPFYGKMYKAFTSENLTPMQWIMQFSQSKMETRCWVMRTFRDWDRQQIISLHLKVVLTLTNQAFLMITALIKGLIIKFLIQLVQPSQMLQNKINVTIYSVL